MTSLSDVGIVATDILVRKFQINCGTEFVQSTRALRDLEDAVACHLGTGGELFFREDGMMCYPNKASFLHGMTATLTLGADRARAGERALTAKEVRRGPRHRQAGRQAGQRERES